MWILIFTELLGVFLCFLSIFNTYRDIYTHDDIKFGDLFGMFDDTIYTVELTEKPEEIYSSFYMVKVGDNALLVTGIEDDLEKLKEEGSVKVRGRLRPFTTEEEEIELTAYDYFLDNDYYENDLMVISRVAAHYFDCSENIGFIGVMLDNHPMGLVFGTTIFIVLGMCMYPHGLFYCIRCLNPSCGSVRYTYEELTEALKQPEVQKVDYAELYFTPEILIGTQKGLYAVRYDDIDKIYTRKKTRINWSYPKDLLYNVNQIIVVSKNNKKLIMCEVTFFEQGLADLLKEKCGFEVNVESVF